MKKYEILDHPADLKIRAYGKNLSEVFVNMAVAMTEFIYGQNVKKEDEATETITAKGDDQETLLVNWLSEILYLSDVNNRAYLDFNFLELNGKHIKADVKSYKAEARDDIKAVTYNELRLGKVDKGWVGEVVFDI